MCQELGEYVKEYTERWKALCELIQSRKADDRFTPIVRLLQGPLNPYQIRLVDTSLDHMRALNSYIVDLMGAGMALVQYKDMGSGEALTVGTVLSHLKMLTMLLDEMNTTFTQRELEHLQAAYFPTLERKVVETFLVAGRVDARYMALLKQEGFGIAFDAEDRLFRINTKHGTFAVGSHYVS